MILLHPAASQLVLLGNLSICAACRKRGATKKCTACKCCNYCSVDCQRADWKTHKKICPTLKEAIDGSQRSESSTQMVQEKIQSDSIAGDETNIQGYELFSKGLDLTIGIEGFLKGYPDREKMGERIEPDKEEGNKLIMKAAKLGHPGAQYATALNYRPGGFYYNACDEPWEECHMWIEKAANNGHAEAQVTYGNTFWIRGDDDHHPLDKDKGLYWLRKALINGVSDSGQPDPLGNALSEKSFQSTLVLATEIARQLFLYKYSSIVNDLDTKEEIRICADCGVGGALEEAKYFGRND